jgi:tetratricopeptide (TPR) repeat protein
VLSATPWTIGVPDDIAERFARADELIRLASEVKDERLANEGHIWKAGYYLELGDIAAVDREAEIQERLAERSRHAFHRWVTKLMRGGRAFLEGRFDECEVEFLRPPESDALDSETLLLGWQGFRNLVLEQQGRVQEILGLTSNLAAAFPQIVMWRVSEAGYRLAAGEIDVARRTLESLPVDDLSSIPRDMMWLYLLSRLTEVVGFFGDAPRAAPIYDLLLPYADRCAAISIAACRGAVSRPLGVLATVLGRHDDAERHFEHALAMNARIRARVWIAHTQHDYARMLVARDRPGDRERAAALAADALAAAREIGMKPLEAQVRELRASAGLGDDESGERSIEAAPTTRTPAVFRRDGDVWTIAYDGKRVRLRDAKGVQYIAQLLRCEGRELHAAELAAGPATSAPAGERETTRGLGDAGEVLDAQARGEYRRRLEELKEEAEEATRWGDVGRATKLREEIEFLTDELAAAMGLGGRARKAGDVADRARKAVTSRIRETIERISREHPVLGRHLENAIRTGLFCSYQPDRSPGWET